MNKICGIVILLSMCLVALAGCTKSNGRNQLKEVPTLQLEYTMNGTAETVIVKPGTSSWEYRNTATETDSLHPLQSVGYMPEIMKADDLEEIRLSFSSAPTSYTVRYWADTYANKEEAFENYYNEVEVSEDTILVPKDETGFIYEIHATWSQGNAYYAFYITKLE